MITTRTRRVLVITVVLFSGEELLTYLSGYVERKYENSEATLIIFGSLKAYIILDLT